MFLRFDPFADVERSAPPAGRLARNLSMPADAYRLDDRVYVHLDLPGVEPDAFDITVERNTLTVVAERSWSLPEGAVAVLNERPQGRFTRTFFLGEGLDPDRIEATYDDGVLTLVVSLAEEAKARKIVVGSNEPALSG